jgi:hypothetical protein
MGKTIIGWIAWTLAFGSAFFLVRFGVPYVRGQQAGLSGPTRDAYVGAAIRTCTAKQVNAPENASIPKPMLISFCNCYANGLADGTSFDELNSTSGLTEADKITKMKPLIEVVAKACTEELGKELYKVQKNGK